MFFFIKIYSAFLVFYIYNNVYKNLKAAGLEPGTYFRLILKAMRVEWRTHRLGLSRRLGISSNGNRTLNLSQLQSHACVFALGLA